MDSVNAPSLRTALKTAARVREQLLTLHDQLKDMERFLHELDGDGPGVRSAIALVDNSLEVLVESLETLTEEELEVSHALTQTLKKK